MPESLVLRFFCEDINRYAQHCGPGLLTFHPQCCTRPSICGSRATVSLHCCPKSDPFFHSLPSGDEDSNCSQCQPTWVCSHQRQFTVLQCWQGTTKKQRQSASPVTTGRSLPVVNALGIRGNVKALARGKELVLAIGKVIFSSQPLQMNASD